MNNAIAVTLSDPFESTNRLKQVFEQSLAVLGENQFSKAGQRQPSRSPLRSMPLHINAASLQKRAIANAAEALTALWKISPRSNRKIA